VSPAATAKRLVRGALAEDGTVRDEVAALLLRLMSRSQMKAFVGALRREQRRRTVSVEIAGDVGPAGRSVAERYPGRSVEVAQDSALGAGVRVRAGDDIVDASVRGIIRKIIAELGTNAPGAQKNASGTQTNAPGAQTNAPGAQT
jgi:hypothetical protein